jgi:hypothetical protein
METGLAPHFKQNLASTAFSAPQSEHACTSGLPQFWQKRASSGLFFSQFGHFIDAYPMNLQSLFHRFLMEMMQCMVLRMCYMDCGYDDEVMDGKI